MEARGKGGYLVAGSICICIAFFKLKEGISGISSPSPLSTIFPMLDGRTIFRVVF